MAATATKEKESPIELKKRAWKNPVEYLIESGWEMAGGAEPDDPRSKWIDPKLPKETKKEEVLVKEILDKDRRKIKLMQTRITHAGKEFPMTRSDAVAVQLQRDLAKYLIESGWEMAGGAEPDDPRSKWIDPKLPKETKK